MLLENIKSEILAISGNLKVEIFMFQFQGDDRIYNVLDDGRRTSLDRVYIYMSLKPSNNRVLTR